MREDGYFYYWICDFGHFYEVRKNSLPHGGIWKRFFLDHFSPSFLGQNGIFGHRLHFEGKNNVWISQVRHVKYSAQKLQFQPFWNPSMREDRYFYYWIYDFGHFCEKRESGLPNGGIKKNILLDHFYHHF
jgi:hypothetical protein